jgi:hypothetical protein
MSNITPDSSPSPTTLVQVSGIPTPAAGLIWQAAVKAGRSAAFFDGSEFIGSTEPDPAMDRWIARGDRRRTA